MDIPKEVFLSVVEMPLLTCITRDTSTFSGPPRKVATDHEIEIVEIRLIPRHSPRLKQQLVQA